MYNMKKQKGYKYPIFGSFTFKTTQSDGYNNLLNLWVTTLLFIPGYY